MSRCVAALIVTVAIAGVPVVAIVCQVTCASHDTTAVEAHAHHSCPLPAPTPGAGLSAVPHACGHQPGEALQQALQLLTMHVVADDPGSLVPRIDDRDATLRPGDIEHGPPRPLGLTIQLRV